MLDQRRQKKKLQSLKQYQLNPKRTKSNNLEVRQRRIGLGKNHDLTMKLVNVEATYWKTQLMLTSLTMQIMATGANNTIQRRMM